MDLFAHSHANMSWLEDMERKAGFKSNIEQEKKETALLKHIQEEDMSEELEEE